MRKPRDLKLYSSAAAAAKELRGFAADLERDAATVPLVKFNIQFSFWNPVWETPKRGAALVGKGRSNHA